MAKIVLVVSALTAFLAPACFAQSNTVYRLLLPPSATVAGSGCACNGACGRPDSTWRLAGTFSSIGDCQAAIPKAILSVTDSSGNRSSNDCSQTAQCVPSFLGH